MPKRQNIFVVAYPCAMFGSPNPLSAICQKSRTLAVDLNFINEASGIPGTNIQAGIGKKVAQGKARLYGNAHNALRKTYPSPVGSRLFGFLLVQSIGCGLSQKQKAGTSCAIFFLPQPFEVIQYYDAQLSPGLGLGLPQCGLGSGCGCCLHVDY